MGKHSDLVEFEVVKDADGRYRVVYADGSERELLFPDVEEFGS